MTGLLCIHHIFTLWRFVLAHGFIILPGGFWHFGTGFLPRYNKPGAANFMEKISILAPGTAPP